MSEKRKAVAALVAAAVLWSTGGILIKWLNWHPMAIMGVRSAIAAVLLWIIARRPRFNWSPAQIGGAVAYAATVLLYVPACKLTTAANAILLQYTAPVYVALFGAWFLKEKPGWVDWISVLVSLAGMVLFFREGLANQSLLGDLMAAGSGVTIAWMTLFLRKQKEAAPLESVLLGNLLAAAVGLPFAFGQPALTPAGWGGMLLLGVMQLGLSYALYTYAIKRVTALEAILVSTLEPILNPIWVLLLIGERPAPLALVGGTLVLLAVTVRGVFLALRRTSRPQPEHGSAVAETV